MRISELSDKIVFGLKINPSDLTSNPTKHLYLQISNIERGLAISEAGASYIIEKNFKKLSKKPVQIKYNDFLIYRGPGDASYSIVRYTQDLSKDIIPAENIIVISNPQSFLITFLQHEAGKEYILSELEDITDRVAGNLLEIIKQIKLIDIDSRVLDYLNLPGYIPPGNTTISPDELKKINVRSDIITVDNILKRLHENEVRLDGYFQRKSNLWSDDVKSRLIETLILGMPIPPLFFDVTNDDRWLVVDGLQRISAIYSFYRDDLTLINLDYLPELIGKKYSELERPHRRRFEEKQLSYFAIYPGTPKSVRYKIFKNINVSALVLNRQEIRHAINEDEDEDFTSSRYIQELTPILAKHFHIQEKGDNGRERMFDSELCLRFVAFKVLNYKHEYFGSIQDFLDKAMERINGYSINKLESYKNDFENSLRTLAQIFPTEQLFTKSMIEINGATNFNGNLFGVWTYLISRLSDEERNLLIIYKDTFIRKAQELSKDIDYARAIDSRYFEQKENLRINIEFTTKFLKEFLDDKSAEY